VKCLYRRDRANMPGSQREVANAEEGGRRVRLALRPAGFAATRSRACESSGCASGAPTRAGGRAPNPQARSSSKAPTSS
jgi:glutamate synthase (NADPH/NADH) small chain